MKKSNKISVFYILSSIMLLFVLVGGGVYGIYVSLGFKFMNNTFSNVVGGVDSATNVAYSSGGYAENYSMTGVIILSIALIVLAIFDFISMIKQLMFFKQFKVVKNSTLEQVVERKVKSKKSVIVFACTIDVLSFIVGVVGLFVNARTMPRITYSWVFYLIDGFVCLFAIVSLVLLFVKLKKVKENYKQMREECERTNTISTKTTVSDKILNHCVADIDNLEYFLLKLKHLKSSKVISVEEYSKLRELIFGFDFKDEKIKVEQEKNKEI